MCKTLEPKLKKTTYWKGPSKVNQKCRNFKKTPTESGPKRSLTAKDELVLILMKCRLGLLNQDLAEYLQNG